MSGTILRVEKLENGYEVEVCDEKIMAENRKPKSVYEDPWKSYAFETAAGVVEFIKTHLDKLKPPPGAEEEYSSAFKMASKEE